MTKLFRSIILFLFFIILNMIYVNNSTAVWKGIDATNNTRVVPIFASPVHTGCSSGFLYSSRIVFTAAHTILKYDYETKIMSQRFEKFYVGTPGQKTFYASKRVEVEAIFVPDNYKERDKFPWSAGSIITRQNDFAILILKTPLKTDNKMVELMTPELHEQYIQNKEKIKSAGYGAQSAEQIQQPCENRNPMSYESEVTSKTFYTNNEIFTATLNFKIGIDQPHGCDGDSGSGYYKEYDDKIVYLGAMGAGSWMSHNCESWMYPRNMESVFGADPVYNFTNLIKNAENYLLKYNKKKAKNTCNKKNKGCGIGVR